MQRRHREESSRQGSLMTEEYGVFKKQEEALRNAGREDGLRPGRETEPCGL